MEIQAETPVAPPLRYCIYARKSTEAEERQALSIDSQIKEMRSIAKRNKLRVVALKKEAHSAKDSGKRPVFNEIVNDIKGGSYNAILTWAPDRLSRNAGDLGQLVDLMDHGHLHEIRTFNQSFSNSPNEKFLLMILCSQAKLENDNRGINVKRGLRTRVQMGLWPSSTPLGYRTLKRTDKLCEVEPDPERAPIIKEMFEKVAYEGWSQHQVYAYLKDIDFKTPLGKNPNLSTIQNFLHRTFYYGRFEFPKGSGKWYKGKHEPLITKELFDLAQEAIYKKNTKRFGKSYVFAPFNFLHLMKCGACGGGITAQETHKYRKKTNDIARFRYYMCTKACNRRCSQLYINEADLIAQLAEIIDKVDLDLIGLREEFETAIHKSYKYLSFLTGEPYQERDAAKRDVDLRTWAKMVFESGTPEEQRSILYNLKSRILLKDKHIYLDESVEQKPLPQEPTPPPGTFLEFITTDRGFAHWLMQTYAVSPGQTLHLPGGARLIFQEATWGKKSKLATFTFLIEGIDGVAGRMFSKWLQENLQRRRKSVKRITLNDKKVTVDSIRAALEREAKAPVFSAKNA